MINDIMSFDEKNYGKQIINLFVENNVQEDGKASEKVVKKIMEGM